jgi:hypothetical protein
MGAKGGPKLGEPQGSGLYVSRERTCPCGEAFTARAPAARYCSRACRDRYSRYGRSYGQYEARRLGVTKS